MPHQPSRSNSSAGTNLGLATVATLVVFAAWSILGPLGPQLQRELRITDSQLSLLIVLPILLGAVLRVPLGICADRFGPRRMLLGVLVFTPLPLLGLALYHDSYAGMLALSIGLGVAGSAGSAGTTFLKNSYPRTRHGFALGVYGFGVAGSAVGALCAPRLAAHFGLAAPFLVVAVLLTAVTVVFLCFTDEQPGREADAAVTPVGAELSALARRPKSWATMAYYFVGFGGFVACMAYLPKMLVGTYGVPPATAGMFAAAFAALSVTARFSGGLASDRIGPRPVLLAAFALIGVCSAALAAGYTEAIVMVMAMTGLSLAFGAAGGATMKVLARDFPDNFGSAAGIVMAAGGLGGFVPPLLMAYVLTQTGTYALAFLALGGCAGACLLVMGAVGHRRTCAVQA